jgi:hypothetical protein
LFVPQTLLTYSTNTTVAIDGEAPVASTTATHWYAIDLGGDVTARSWLGASADYEQTVIVAPKGLAVGRHTLHVRSTIGMLGVDASCTKEMSADFEVVPGSTVERAVRLVPGVRPRISVKAGMTRSLDLFASAEEGERPIAMRVEVVEGSAVVLESRFLTPTRHGGGASLGYVRSKGDLATLGSGQHALQVRFTPDARVAFENDLDLTEIAGEPVVVDVQVNVP